MTSRYTSLRGSRGLSSVLAVTALGLSFSATALAQDPAASASAAPTASDSSAPAASSAAPADTAAPAEPPPAADPAAPAEPAAAPTDAAATPPPASDSAAAGGTASASLGTSGLDLSGSSSSSSSGTEPSAPDASAAAQPPPPAIKIEQLQPAPVPDAYVSGIKHASMAGNSQGYQWPYVTKDAAAVRIGISGSVWNDLSNTRIQVDKVLKGANINDQDRWTTQTRGVLRLTPTYNANGGWFGQANAEFIAQGDMSPDPAIGGLSTTDDLWIRIGKWNAFDLTVGRFQGWEIANHYGMGLDINTLERQGAWIVTANIPKPTDGYGLTHFWDRQNKLVGGYALHIYPTKYLRAELLGHFGAGSMNAGQPYQMDIRPSAIFDIGWVKVKAGWEYGNAIPQDVTQPQRESKNGFGFAAQFVVDPYIEFGGSFARGYNDVIDKDGQADLLSSGKAQTFGGYANVSPGIEPLVFGLGAFLSNTENFRYDTAPGPHNGMVDTNAQWLLFGAAQYNIWDQLAVKLVLSHASNKAEHYKAGNYVNNALSARFRVSYAF